VNCYLYKLPAAEQTLHLLSPLSAEEIGTQQSRSELFLGRLVDPELGATPENISYNADFLVVLHELVRDLMVIDPGVIAEAKSQPNGFVFIVDRRAQAENNEKVEKEDVIGIFLVNEYATDASRYRPNPDYRLVSSRGMAMLPEVVEEELIRKLLSRQ
jgi:hypothetical protein